MYVLSQDFGQKVVKANMLYSNLMKYNILYMITKVQLINKQIIWSKRQKNAKYIFEYKFVCVYPKFWP